VRECAFDVAADTGHHAEVLTRSGDSYRTLRELRAKQNRATSE
jgi:hypothetical protein